MTSLVLILMVTATGAFAQPPVHPSAFTVPDAGVIQELELMDRTVLIGQVESVGDDVFTFRTTAGVVATVNHDQVRSIKPVNGRIVAGEHWPADPNPTRLLVAPTGRSLGRGDVTFGLYGTVLPFVQVGVTDRVSIGGGAWPGPTGGDQPAWVTPKVKILDTGRTAASVGAMHLFNAAAGGGDFGVAYAVATRGSTDSAATIGIGYAYTQSGDGVPLVAMIGGERRLSRRTKVITENYISSIGGLASVGFRRLGTRLSTDFALIMPLQGDYFGLAPVINLVWKF